MTKEEQIKMCVEELEKTEKMLEIAVDLLSYSNWSTYERRCEELELL